MTFFGAVLMSSFDEMMNHHFCLFKGRLLLSSADSLYKHFGPRSGPTKLFNTEGIPDRNFNKH